MGFLDRVQKAVFDVAEGIGRTFERGAMIPGRVGASAASKLAAAGKAIPSMVSGLGENLQSGVFHGAEAIARPQTMLPGLAKLVKSGATQTAALGRMTQRALHQAGFVTPFGKQYFQQLGGLAKQAPSVIGPLIGRGARGMMGGLGSALGMGAAGLSKSASATAATAKGMASLASPAAGIPKVVGLLRQLVGATALTGVLMLLKKLTVGLNESNRDLAKWNGAIAASFAKFDIAQMRLDIQTAKATSGTAVGLNEALAEVLQEFQPIREDLGILVNMVGISSAKVLKTMIITLKEVIKGNEHLKEIEDGLHIIEDEMKKDKPQGAPGNEALAAIAAMRGAGPAQGLPQPENFGDFMNHVRGKLRPGWWDKRGRKRH